MSDSVKRLLKVREVVEQIALLLGVLLCDNSTVEDLFYCSPAWPKTCLFLCQQFRNLAFVSAEDYSQQDRAD